MSQHEPAEPIPKGIIACARQNFHDLFIWKQRVIIENTYGENRAEWQSPPPLYNPFSLLSQLTLRNWFFILVGLSAWTADAFDYHALAIQTVKFASYYQQTNTSITTAITLTLLLRSVGAGIFGLAGDRFGRKWPMVLNLFAVALLQIATIYSTSYQQFLAVRSLFGIFMGGVWGSAIAMGLENCPVDARGLISGFLQQGYSLGYVLVACTNLGVGGSPESFKTVFWIASGLSFGAGILRICCPESKQFRDAKKKDEKGVSAKAFWLELKMMLVTEWRIVIYCVVLMTWFNFYSHAASDSYTTFMLQGKGLDNSAASRASIFMKAGSCVGGPIIGYLSQWIGRRRAMVGLAIISGLLIPAWILPQGERALSASAFFMQFAVQGAWSVIPIHLNELSPMAFRSLFPGVTYQIGNMISSPSVQIVNAIAESIKISGPSGKPVPAYGPVMGVATAVIIVGIICTTVVGPEKRGSRFENAPIAGQMIAQTKDAEASMESPNLGDVKIAGLENEEKAEL